MVRRVVFSSLAALLVAGLAWAQPQPYRHDQTREGRWEFNLQTRYTTAKDFDGAGGSKVELDDDLGWGFGFGYHFNPRFCLGMLFGWRSIGYQATVVDRDDPANTWQYSNQLETSTIGLTGDWNILPGKITPYVSGGLAWMLIDTNIYAGTDWGCYYDPWWGYVCYDYSSTYGDDAATWSLGAGVRFELTPSFFARVGYEHGWIDADAIDGADMFRVDIGLLN